MAKQKQVQFIVGMADRDEPVEVFQPGLSVLVRFEKHFGIPATVLEPETEEVLDENGAPVLDEDGSPKLRVISEFRLEWICFLLWRQMIRQGELPEDAPFDDDFMDQIEDVEVPDAVQVDGEGESLDPSVPAPSTD